MDRSMTLMPEDKLLNLKQRMAKVQVVINELDEKIDYRKDLIKKSERSGGVTETLKHQIGIYQSLRDELQGKWLIMNKEVKALSNGI